MNNIVLIGFMGCGKSCIGRKLSYKLQKTLLDIDKQIEKEQNRTISEIFETDGEESFRRMETEYLKSLGTNCNNQIISTGGGLPIREENRVLIKKLGCIIFLRVTAESIYERLHDDMTRPLLQGENPKQKIKELLEKRADIYESIADIIIDTDDKEFDQILNEIQEELKKYETADY